MDLLDLLAFGDSPASVAATGDPIPKTTRCECGTTAYGASDGRNATTTRLPDGRWLTTSHCNCHALAWRDLYGRRTT